MCHWCTEHGGRDEKWYTTYDNFLFNKMFPTPEEQEEAKKKIVATFADTEWRYTQPQYHPMSLRRQDDLCHQPLEYFSFLGRAYARVLPVNRAMSLPAPSTIAKDFVPVVCALSKRSVFAPVFSCSKCHARSMFSSRIVEPAPVTVRDAVVAMTAPLNVTSFDVRSIASTCVPISLALCRIR